MAKFKITITGEVIQKSLYCGVQNKQGKIISPPYNNCAFAVAFRELIPNTEIADIYTIFNYKSGVQMCRIKNTPEQISFIKSFDELFHTPQARYELAGREFEVEIPDEVIEYWHGNAVTAAQKIINNPILQLV